MRDVPVSTVLRRRGLAWTVFGGQRGPSEDRPILRRCRERICLLKRKVCHGHGSVARSPRGKTRKSGGGRELPAWRLGGRPRGAGDYRVVRNPHGTVDVRHLRRL